MADKKFLDEDGLRFLLTCLGHYIDEKTQLNIVSSIDENSTNQEIAGAKAVYDLLTAALAGIVKVIMEVVDSLPATGESSVIYLVRADDDTYTQYIYTGGQWFDLGTTDIDLSGYWAKDELEALTNAEIQVIIDEELGA